LLSLTGTNVLAKSWLLISQIVAAAVTNIVTRTMPKIGRQPSLLSFATVSVVNARLLETISIIVACYIRPDEQKLSSNIQLAIAVKFESAQQEKWVVVPVRPVVLVECPFHLIEKDQLNMFHRPFSSGAFESDGQVHD
jgi:hypothetical protein